MNLSELYNNNLSPKHKTFISFHHDDDYYKRYMEIHWGAQLDGFVSRSVGEGDIDRLLSTDRIRQLIRDDFIAEATVMVVLVGTGTWRRKHVDWEIASGLRDTKNNSRTGLLGLLLPTCSSQSYGGYISNLQPADNFGCYDPQTIPPRLYDNIKSGFAKIYNWPASPVDLREWVHEAFQRRKELIPDNSRAGYSNNRSVYKTHWVD